jgi:hypothetical protein
VSVALVLALWAAAGVAGSGSALAAGPGFTPVEVTVRPVEAFRVEPGSRVEYRGGLVLASRDRGFGSWSGLDFSTDGTLYAIADDGYWLRVRLVESGGRLVGIGKAELAPLVDERGQPITRKVEGDAEGLRIVRRGGVEIALVSFEQNPAVRSFSGPDFAAPQPRQLAIPREFNRAFDNRGLEAIAVAPSDGSLAGAVVVIAEHILDRNGNHRGHILDGPRPGAFALRRTADYDVSDAAFLPNGDLLVLERKFALLAGFAIRIRQIPAATIAPGALLDGWTLLEGDAKSGIDNMEGLAVRMEPDGTALLTLIADDNHSFLQRTIILEFAVKPAPPVRPRPRPGPLAAVSRPG